MSDDDIHPRAKQQAKAEPRQARFFEWDLVGPAYHGATDVVEKRIDKGLDVNMVDQATGLSALHVAVGTDNLALTKKLVEEHGAAFFADNHGRHDLPRVFHPTATGARFVFTPIGAG